MIKYRSRTHYTLMQIRSGNTAKTGAELAEMANQKPSTITRSLDTLLKHGMIQEVQDSRSFKGTLRTHSYDVTAYKITPKGIEVLLILARQATRNIKDSDYSYDKILERQANYKRKVKTS